MYYVYILKTVSGHYYTGFTTNIESRVKDHKSNKCKTTSRLKFDKIIWFAGFSNEKLARNFEVYLKSSSGFAFRNKRLI